MKNRKRKRTAAAPPKYPGILSTEDGSSAVVAMETAGSEAAGAYPITPSTQMGEGWAAASAAGELNVNRRPLLFFEPEGEHAAAAVTAGMSMVGLRAANFSSGQGIAYMHESLYAAVGKRLTYVLNVATRAMTKHSLNVHAGHDDYHSIDDTGFFQLFAKDVQEAADLNLIAHRIAELALNPGICAQDGFLTSHVLETIRLPERELIKEFLGDPADTIDSPTPAQRLVFGETRRRIPVLYDFDYPAMLGVVQNQDSYAQGVAAQRPFYFDHLADLADRAFGEFEALTGRSYARAGGYRLDADWLIVGQGSVVANAEAVSDYLRRCRGLDVGVLNLRMFRPFPSELITHILKGKNAVVVLERLDQPLAVDPPLMREIRAAASKAVENGLADTEPPYPELAAFRSGDLPSLYSGCFGLGSRDLQAGDIVAAVDNMLEGGERRRHFYLGVEFLRPETRLPKLQIWQDQLRSGYPQLEKLALPSAGDLDLLPEGSTAIRIHSIGGWGAITMGKNLALTAAEVFALHVKANPKYGSEKKGQPTTFYATLAKEPVRMNCELRHVDVVLSPDPNVFKHSDPLAGLAQGGLIIIQSEGGAEAVWRSLPQNAQRVIRERAISVYHLDAFKIASEEASDPNLRIRMQGAAFMGAFFRVAPLVTRSGLDQTRVLEGIRDQLAKKFGHRGAQVVEDNVRVISRGFEAVQRLDPTSMPEAAASVRALPTIPEPLNRPQVAAGIGHPGRFWEQVGHLYRTGEDGIADPFAALSAMPAATSSIRDMTDVRFEVPDFIADRCTGCSQCWVQCPDTAIPARVNTVEEILEAAAATASNGQSLDRFRQIAPHVAKHARRAMKAVPLHSFAEILRQSYDRVIARLAPPPERREALDREFSAVYSVLAEAPLAKTAPFFDLPEAKATGTGGLLSITIDPVACKGCNLCVDVCPDGALVTIPQDDAAIDKLRRNHRLWHHLPDTDDRYVNVRDLEEGIGILPSLLLKKDIYQSMTPGDGACMGCGEKTAVHLVVSAVNSLMLPRVEKFAARLRQLIDGLDARARDLLASEADLQSVGECDDENVGLPLAEGKRQEVNRIAGMIRELEDLEWRYREGPGGNGRAKLGFANSTGCSSVWGSTYPYNPYPFPWVNHLFQDAPSVALGIFEGHMRKMADGFAAVRRAELQLEGRYDPDEHDPFFTRFDWHHFSDEELGLCPPLFAVGGDGAMLDIGFQNLSRLMAAGKPLRVVVLDTQVYSNTGGQACTSGYLGQVSDMATFGAAQHGKEETRKEMSLLAMAHREVFVLQSSQASPSHLISGVIQGLQSKRPAVFILHCPCPPEHGIGDSSSMQAAKHSLESRAFPILVYDPDAGETFAECLNLDGNPSIEDRWPSYDLTYVGDDGEEHTESVPLTVADWAAHEGRFAKHFRPVPEDAGEDELMAFDRYVAADPTQRQGVSPFIHTLDGRRRRGRLLVSAEIVRLAEDRLLFWSQLKQLAGLEVPPVVRAAVTAQLEDDFDRRLQALSAEYQSRIERLEAEYPIAIARRLAGGLLRAGGDRTLAELIAEVEDTPSLRAPTLEPPDTRSGHPAAGSAVASLPVIAETTARETVADEDDEDDELSIAPYIETARCTSCDECTNLNREVFAYDENKQAYIKDANAGSFKDLVTAAERCPVHIIHPGTPQNPREPNLEKWIRRAEALA